MQVYVLRPLNRGIKINTHPFTAIEILEKRKTPEKNPDQYGKLRFFHENASCFEPGHGLKVYLQNITGFPGQGFPDAVRCHHMVMGICFFSIINGYSLFLLLQWDGCNTIQSVTSPSFSDSDLAQFFKGQNEIWKIIQGFTDKNQIQI